ncbi:amidase family protein [Solirhodobacter olei]|uniref:amidase family protein n=1 Tax=Solirhodobacter olei TaxID=2493082 RepID=UPI0019D47BF6|nr:amidase family protein [Solirhodobacter olei]
MEIEYHRASARQMLAALSEGAVSARELVEAAIARIEAVDGAVNAVVMRDFEGARATAREADEALRRGEQRPLLGLPITVKESHRTVGLPTTWGLKQFATWTADVDGATIARLKGAGAVIIGKTNVPPGLAGWESSNAIYGRTSNPYNLAHSPGGSSGGSAAALAAGMVSLELGSDLAGSIRVPAHFCGVFGHKPTAKLVSSTDYAPPGAMVGADPGLAVVGPMARTAGDLTLALKVLAGPEFPKTKAWRLQLPAPRANRLFEFRVLVLERHPLVDADEEVVEPLRRLADRLANVGARVERADGRLPDLELTHRHYCAMADVVTRRDTSMTTGAWMELLNARDHIRRAWEAVFRDFDVVLAPPFGTAAFPHDDKPVHERTLIINGGQTPYLQQRAWAGIASFPGLPSTCMPAGVTSAGLPVGVQIIAPLWEDLTALRLAELIEREFGTGVDVPGETWH